MTTKLSQSTLGDLPTHVRVPSYHASDLRAGIVHIGLGNFHRAHQAWYLHRLFDMGLSRDWAIIGAGVRAYDAAQRDKLRAQDYLTTLIELDPAGSSTEVIGSMIDYIEIDTSNGPMIARMAQSDIRIVALTVTEGGYFIDPATQGFDTNHPDIQHDAQNPETPRTAFGAMVAALKIRRDTGVGPFTGQSCDNLQGNGDILRQTVVGLARLSDPDLANWIDANCTFPNSMVDCIVPATGDKERALVKSLGINDAAPVTHENFRQWVIEDKFCAGRPDWDKAGATFTDHVHTYETMKIRILNGGHQVIANAAEILGVETISGCMEHPKINALFQKVAREEVAPFVAAVPDMEPLSYVDLITARFSNPKIVDTTRRVAFDGSSRHPGFILPSLRDALSNGGKYRGLALAEAAWARMCEGTREDGSVIEANDPFWDDLQKRATLAKADPKIWLEMPHIYGDLANDPRFLGAFCEWLAHIWEHGLESAIDRYLAEDA